jgi:gliding motility-associated-like protein
LFILNNRVTHRYLTVFMNCLKHSLIYTLILLNTKILAQQFQIGTPNNYEYGNSITVLADGGTLICGLQYGGNSARDFDAGDALLIRLSAKNQILWSRKLSTGRRDKISRAVCDANGYIYACGYYDHEFNSGNGTGFVVKLDADGKEVWKRNFPAANGTRLNDMVLLSNGNLAMVGSIDLHYTSSDALLVMLDTVGNMLYGKTYDLAFYSDATKGDGFDRVLELNGKLYALGTGRGNSNEAQNLFTTVIKISDGSVSDCREYEYACKNATNSYAMDFFARNGHLIVSAVNVNQWNFSLGTVFHTLDIDLANSYRVHVNILTSGNYMNSGFTCIYPLSHKDYYSVYMPGSNLIGPEEYHVPGINYPANTISQVTDGKVVFSKSNAKKGINGFMKLEMDVSRMSLFGTGISEGNSAQIGFQDILWMKTIANTSPDISCDQSPVSSSVSIDSFSPRVIDPPEDVFNNMGVTGFSMTHFPFSNKGVSNDTLNISPDCGCYKDSIILDDFCAGKVYTLPHGQKVSKAGVYLVDTIMSGDSCHIRRFYKLIVHAVPEIHTPHHVSLCMGDQITLNATATPWPTWSNGILNGKPFRPEKSFTAYVTVSDTNGCVNTDSTLIELLPLPAVDAGLNQTACYGEYVKLEAKGAKTYAWTQGVKDGVPFSFTGTHLFVVSGVDSNNCKSIDSVLVELDTADHGFFAPNSFSPNNDLSNDVYKPLGQGFELQKLSVYNGWGELIFDQPGGDGWDGTYKGELAPQGVYLVMLEYRVCSKYFYKNIAVTLLR